MCIGAFGIYIRLRVGRLDSKTQLCSHLFISFLHAFIYLLIQAFIHSTNGFLNLLHDTLFFSRYRSWSVHSSVIDVSGALNCYHMTTRRKRQWTGTSKGIQQKREAGSRFHNMLALLMHNTTRPFILRSRNYWKRQVMCSFILP